MMERKRLSTLLPLLGYLGIAFTLLFSACGRDKTIYEVRDTEGDIGVFERLVTDLQPGKPLGSQEYLTLIKTNDQNSHVHYRQFKYLYTGAVGNVIIEQVYTTEEDLIQRVDIKLEGSRIDRNLLPLIGKLYGEVEKADYNSRTGYSDKPLSISLAIASAKIRGVPLEAIDLDHYKWSKAGASVTCSAYDDVTTVHGDVELPKATEYTVWVPAGNTNSSDSPSGASSSSSSTSRSDCIDAASVEFNVENEFDNDPDLEISTPSHSYSEVSWQSSTATLLARSTDGCVAGDYSYTYTIDKNDSGRKVGRQTFRGSFHLNGKQKNYTVSINPRSGESSID